MRMTKMKKWHKKPEKKRRRENKNEYVFPIVDLEIFFYCYFYRCVEFSCNLNMSLAVLFNYDVFRFSVVFMFLSSTSFCFHHLFAVFLRFLDYFFLPHLISDFFLFPNVEFLLITVVSMNIFVLFERLARLHFTCQRRKMNNDKNSDSICVLKIIPHHHR